MSTTNKTGTTTPTTTTAAVVEGDPCETDFHMEGECDGCKRHSKQLTVVTSHDDVLGIWVCPACRREALDAEEARASLVEQVSDAWDRHNAHADARRVCLGRR
jgi:hypothetical protein